MRKIKTGYRFNDFIYAHSVLDRQGGYVLLETIASGSNKYYSIGRVLIKDGDEDIFVIPGDYSFHEGANPTDIKTPLTLEEIRVKYLKIVEDEQKKLAAIEERRKAQEKAHQEAVAKQSKLSREEKLARIYRAKDQRNAALEELRTFINNTESETDIIELSKSKKLQAIVDRCNVLDYLLSNLKS